MLEEAVCSRLPFCTAIEAGNSRLLPPAAGLDWAKAVQTCTQVEQGGMHGCHCTSAGCIWVLFTGEIVVLHQTS